MASAYGLVYCKSDEKRLIFMNGSGEEWSVLTGGKPN